MEELRLETGDGDREDKIDSPPSNNIDLEEKESLL